MVRPRSCRVIYYFDTSALGRRHQSFGRVSYLVLLYVSMTHNLNVLRTLLATSNVVMSQVFFTKAYSSLS